MAMAIRGERRANDVVLVWVHVGNVEETATEVLARPGLELAKICIGGFDRRCRSDRKGREEDREETQHDCLLS